MKEYTTSIVRGTVHKLTGTRKFYYKQLSSASETMRKKTILEFGSGKKVGGKQAYSAKHLFHNSNDFICTDINPDYGHKVVDITKMKDKAKYDAILCLNVLEHVYETKTAIANLHNALKKGGSAYIAVPVHFPLHDEPHDYWRFTEHSLRKLLEQFGSVTILPKGPRKFPFGYFVIASK